MNLYYIDGQFSLATSADVPRIDAWDLLNQVIGHCHDVTLHGRRFRVWTDDPEGLAAYVDSCNSNIGAVVEADILDLDAQGLHLEVLDGWPDELHGATCHLSIENAQHTADYDECSARLALYAATACYPERAQAYINKD